VRNALYVTRTNPPKKGPTQITDQIGSATTATIATTVTASAVVPWHVSFFGRILKFLVVHGVPLAPNRLVTIRGRKSGLPRTTPVAIIAVSGRRWVWAPFGDVNWVRNLRGAGRATITVRRRQEEVRATELEQAQRVEYFRDILGPLARSIPFGSWFIRIADRVDLNHPVEAAEGRPVFELHRLH
jgi:deazaflavin-dependent oxidoreductase (nitroreductase family)